jgi:hypothetical protein
MAKSEHTALLTLRPTERDKQAFDQLCNEDGYTFTQKFMLMLHRELWERQQQAAK